MKNPLKSLILDTFFRYILPFIIVYGIYVLFFGEYSPGGGFQAGALLAFIVIITRLVQGKESIIDISGEKAILLASAGGFIFAFIGLLPVIFGGNIFNYGVFPLDLPENEIRPLGILGIEIGVTMCVMGVIISIYDALTGKDEAE